MHLPAKVRLVLSKLSVPQEPQVGLHCMKKNSLIMLPHSNPRVLLAFFLLAGLSLSLLVWVRPIKVAQVNGSKQNRASGRATSG
jgi:hypothetical protein